MHMYDRATWNHVLCLPLDPELSALLTARFRLLEADGLLNMTDAVVVTGETTEADLIAAIGWTPLIDPDGRRHDDPGFIPPFDYVYRAARHHHIAVQLVGNAGHAFELIVSDGADPSLMTLLRALAV